MKYDIIYADPPWKYNSGGARGGKFAKLDYSDMSIKQLKEMRVQDITKPDCALFMWVTSPFLPEAIALGEAWGFKYIRVDKVWIKKTVNDKPHAVCGPWGMTDCEFILLFTKGKVCNKQRKGHRNQYTAGDNVDVVEAIYPGVHSRKPDIFRDMISNRFPITMDRLEMFARESNRGWSVFGNEVENSISIDYVIKKSDWLPTNEPKFKIKGLYTNIVSDKLLDQAKWFNKPQSETEDGKTNCFLHPMMVRGNKWWKRISLRNRTK